MEVMKKFKEQFHQYDMMTPLQAPTVYRDIVGEDAWDAQWDASNPYREIVDRTLHWTSCRWTKLFGISCLEVGVCLSWEFLCLL